jgi:hypothetical protein
VSQAVWLANFMLVREEGRKISILRPARQEIDLGEILEWDSNAKSGPSSLVSGSLIAASCCGLKRVSQL